MVKLMTEFHIRQSSGSLETWSCEFYCSILFDSQNIVIALCIVVYRALYFTD